ncbi:MAG: cyclic pyranopterin monophosphate synthase MoaC [Firmicutes bacterium]|jgi:cyclic pyranopterin phosphate synthase|uniref:Cyclic pyranopterin monophosphate synthase n=1 Tax=Sulfobacillus benefaciens TaxID=453960 RepID=A0A2T2X1G4_9FIRM|nr:cyclic pyranopterin monophosphate synthase MoaC [Bacillota bacterium]MCL5012861.1 cyclic pyranopterin monophosphate synthase MoaC [Bacillota bacterium]PSR28312.1 MAG: cyclic pyranopterin monophosphate synthase MoaC [Sulfobacillus benefaciens]
MDNYPNHLNERGEVHMVDVGQKAPTERMARARGILRASPQICEAVLSGRVPKGDVLAVSRVAGIMAAKKTGDWIPLCHPLPLTGTEIRIEVGQDRFVVESNVRTTAPTGVEMEALTAVTASLLTLYDMLKAMDRTMVLSDINLVEKSGGRSGHFIREGEDYVENSDSHQ